MLKNTWSLFLSTFPLLAQQKKKYIYIYESWIILKCDLSDNFQQDYIMFQFLFIKKIPLSPLPWKGLYLIIM